MSRFYALSSWLASCLNRFQLKGWDPERVLGNAGVDPSVLKAPYCSAEVVNAVFSAAAECYGEFAGLESRRGIVPGTFHSLSLAVLASKNLRDGLALMVKHNEQYTNAVQYFLNEESSPEFGFIFDPGVRTHPAVTDAILSTAVRTCRFIQPLDAAIDSVCLARPQPADPGLYHTYLRSPVHWNANRFAIRFNPEYFYAPSIHASPALLEQNLQAWSDLVKSPEYKSCRNESGIRELGQEESLNDLVFSSTGSPFLAELKIRIINLLHQGDVTVVKVAAASNTSVRSLQRRLHHEGTSFKELLDRIRRQEALKCVENMDLSITHIAHSLGFTDAGNFSRAFKRWFSCSPNQYRQSVLGRSANTLEYSPV